MPNAYYWIAFFGAPLMLILVTAFIFRPSARDAYRQAKHVIFKEENGPRL